MARDALSRFRRPAAAEHGWWVGQNEFRPQMEQFRQFKLKIDPSLTISHLSGPSAHDDATAGELDASGHVGRKATDADCSKLCSDGSNEHWCVGFEFRETPHGMCELYDDCSEPAPSPAAAASPAPSVTAEEHSTPAATEAAAQAASSGSGDLIRCLRVSDHNFDASFSKQLDGSGNVGRRATEADCSKLCFDGSSKHHTWCVGFEFRETEKGTCELYDMCTPEVDKERKAKAAKAEAAKATPAMAAPTKRLQKLQKAQVAPPSAV